MSDLAQIDWRSLQIPAAIIISIIAFVIGVAVALATLKLARQRADLDERLSGLQELVDRKLQPQVASLKASLEMALEEQKAHYADRASYSPESVVHKLLTHPAWKQRTFEEIQSRFDGYAEGQLKRILVQAGAIRFTRGGAEYWGLIERNRDVLDARDAVRPLRKTTDEIPNG
jgi:hypothetical protein